MQECGLKSTQPSAIRSHSLVVSVKVDSCEDSKACFIVCLIPIEPKSFQPCFAQCFPSKCECKSGFVREGGSCIDPKECTTSIKLAAAFSAVQSYGTSAVMPISFT